MKKMFLLLLVTVIMPNTWMNINSSEPTPMLMELIDSDVNKTKIKFNWKISIFEENVSDNLILSKKNLLFDWSKIFL